MTVGWLTWRWAPAIAVAMQGLVLVAFFVNTRPLEVNGGLGYDGKEYAAIVSWLRGDLTRAPRQPFAYRLLPSALVAATGLEVRTGFLALEVGSFVASSLLLLAMLRRAGAKPQQALLLVLWYALLPTGLRYAIAYPVLVDGVGMLLFVALLASAQARRKVWFALLLVPAVLTREHLILLAPLAVTPGSWRTRIEGAVLAVPALAALSVVRLAAPYPAPGGGPFDFLAVHVSGLLRGEQGEPLRLLAAPLLALGILACAPLVFPRPALAVLRRPWWAYVLVVVVVSGILGGVDYDRYFLWLAPFALMTQAHASWRPLTGTVLTGLHILATRALVPLDGSAGEYLGHMVGSMPLSSLALWAIVAAAAVLVAALIMGREIRTWRATKPG